MKKHMLSLLIVLCGVIAVVLLFAQNHISGKRIAGIIEEGDIERILVEKWQVVDSELVLTDSNEYAYNGNELVHDISQFKLKISIQSRYTICKRVMNVVLSNS